jgi:hypothetical protein
MRKMKIKIKYPIIFSLGLLLICFSSCTREELESPSPFGPAGFAIIIEMSANPNVLLAGNIRQTSILTTKVTTSEGEPLANRTLIFKMTDWWGNATDVGYFEGYETIKTGITNQDGVVSLTYYGPLKDEIRRDESVYFWATLVHYGREVIQENTSIVIRRDD